MDDEGPSKINVLCEYYFFTKTTIIAITISTAAQAIKYDIYY
jgi:hypothetical protein